MSRPKLLDLFCGAGGCSVGYHRAGFDVVGVDNRPQPRYPFEFHQADALEFVERHGAEFDAIHASPPCQFRSRATAWRGDRSRHPDLLTPLRPLLVATGRPYVIENVEDARRMLINPLLLCGSMFGLRVQRHRYFEMSVPLCELLPPCDHRGLLPFEHKGERTYGDAMGCEWMSRDGHRQAIPPAFTEFVGRQLRAAL